LRQIEEKTGKISIEPQLLISFQDLVDEEKIELASKIMALDSKIAMALNHLNRMFHKIFTIKSLTLLCTRFTDIKKKKKLYDPKSRKNVQKRLQLVKAKNVLEQKTAELNRNQELYYELYEQYLDITYQNIKDSFIDEPEEINFFRMFVLKRDEHIREIKEAMKDALEKTGCSDKSKNYFYLPLTLIKIVYF
jgi:hypothetical protein